MAFFKARVLPLLDRIYQMAGGGQTAPTSVDVEAPISIVHDVSREAELSAVKTRFGGFFNWQLSPVHAGATTEMMYFKPLELALAGTQIVINEGLKKADVDLWYYGHQIIKLAGAGNLTSAALGMVEAVAGDESYMPYHADEFGILLGYYTNNAVSIPTASVASTITTYYMPVTFAGMHLPFTSPPLYVPGNTFMTSRTTSSGNLNLAIIYRFWIGLKGVLPPGIG